MSDIQLYDCGTKVNFLNIKFGKVLRVCTCFATIKAFVTFRLTVTKTSKKFTKNVKHKNSKMNFYKSSMPLPNLWTCTNRYKLI